MILKITKQKYENYTFQIVQIVLVLKAIILYMFINTKFGSCMWNLMTVQLTFATEQVVQKWQHKIMHVQT